jgi:Tol biopolymer transport system component
MKKFFYLCSTFLLVTLLAACGGDDGSEEQPTQPLPTLAPSATITPTPSDTPPPTTPAPTVPRRATLPPSWTPEPDEGQVITQEPIGPGEFDPNPDQLAFTAFFEQFDRTLWIINEDGSGQRIVIAAAPAFDWMPSGERLAVQLPSAESGAEVFVMERDASNSRVVTAGEFGDDINPVVSPDGNLVAFQADRDDDGARELYVNTIDGSSSTRVSSMPAGDGGYGWSPDSSRLIFTTNAEDTSRELYTVNADGSRETRLTENTLIESDPVWSPGGARIAFTCDNALCLINADGTGLQTLAEPGGMPDWSADAMRILYACEGVCVLNTNNGTSQTIIEGVTAQYPRWSPTEDALIFTTDTPIYTLYVARADGSNLTELATDDQPITAAKWNPVND